MGNNIEKRQHFMSKNPVSGQNAEDGILYMVVCLSILRS